MQNPKLLLAAMTAMFSVMNGGAPAVRRLSDGRLHTLVRVHLPFKRRALERAATLSRNSMRAR